MTQAIIASALIWPAIAMGQVLGGAGGDLGGMVSDEITAQANPPSRTLFAVSSGALAATGVALLTYQSWALAANESVRLGSLVAGAGLGVASLVVGGVSLGPSGGGDPGGRTVLVSTLGALNLGVGLANLSISLYRLIWGRRKPPESISLVPVTPLKSGRPVVGLALQVQAL